MAVGPDFLNDAAAGGVSNISHLGLVDDEGTELTGGSYARLAVTWGSPTAGAVHPTADLVFDVPANTTVGGWRGYDAASGASGDYGGEDLDPEVYTNAGEYKLLAASTGYDIEPEA